MPLDLGNQSSMAGAGVPGQPPIGNMAASPTMGGANGAQPGAPSAQPNVGLNQLQLAQALRMRQLAALQQQVRQTRDPTMQQQLMVKIEALSQQLAQANRAMQANNMVPAQVHAPMQR